MIRFIDEHKDLFGVEAICRTLTATECGSSPPGDTGQRSPGQPQHAASSDGGGDGHFGLGAVVERSASSRKSGVSDSCRGRGLVHSTHDGRARGGLNPGTKLRPLHVAELSGVGPGHGFILPGRR